MYLDDANKTQLGLRDISDVKPNGQLISDFAVVSNCKLGTCCLKLN